MQIVVNGKTATFSGDPLTIATLLKDGGVESPEMVSVQLNGEFVDRAVYETTLLQEGDEVDFLYFMGGGQK